jgi:hypothetical protein
MAENGDLGVDFFKKSHAGLLTLMEWLGTHNRFLLTTVSIARGKWHPWFDYPLTKLPCPVRGRSKTHITPYPRFNEA